MTSSPSIVILTGAGVSKESGLSTFRDADGIWAQVRIEDVATPEAFAKDPAHVQAFYDMRRAGLLDPAVQPNPAHEALARLEREWPGEVLVITQNIDDLHERAGQKNLIHMHGELLKARCSSCEAVSERRTDISFEETCPGCGAKGTLRPHVVWFGEMPLQMEECFEALTQCALFVSMGTSGAVYPAAGFVREALAAGCPEALELNLEPSDGASFFHRSVNGLASEITPVFVDTLLEHGLPILPRLKEVGL